MKSILAILMISLVCALPDASRADVAPPADTTAKERAGAALIGANVALAIQIGRHLKNDLPGKTWSWIGIGVGTASMALGATETTSFSGGVVVVGAVATVLGVTQLVRHGNASEPQGGNDRISRSLSFCPLVTSSEKSGCGIGILTRVEF